MAKNEFGGKSFTVSYRLCGGLGELKIITPNETITTGIMKKEVTKQMWLDMLKNVIAQCMEHGL